MKGEGRSWQYLRCDIQAWMSFNKAIHFIEGFNPGLPNNIQATILSQHRNVNRIGAKGSRKHKHNREKNETSQSPWKQGS